MNQNYFSNSLNSDINVSRVFPGKPITMGLKSSLRQNSNTKNIVFNAPTFNINITRFSPFGIFYTKNKATQSKTEKFLRQIGMTYNVEGQNASTFKDSLLQQRRFDAISQQFMHGISQQSTIQTTLSLFGGSLKFTPAVNYSNKINFQQTRKRYDAITNNTITDTIQTIGLAQQLSMNANLTTVIYSYYRFVGKKQPLLRHLMTPSIGFRYSPTLNKTITDSVGVNKAPITYSPFERSIYSEGLSSASGLITFGINNTFELKRKSEKDTVDGFKKTRLIDGLSLSGNYNILKDSMRLSDIQIDLRISPVEFLNFVATSSFSPYAWDSLGKTLSSYAIQQNQGLGRMKQLGLNTIFTLTSKKSREKLQETTQSMQENWNSDYQFFALNPNQFIDFEIPLKISFTHNWTFNLNSTEEYINKRYKQDQTILINGDISITKRWKVATTANFNFEAKKITNASLNFTRNMHCWNLSLFWIPVGGNQSFVFRLNATSSLFQDAKIELRNPPQLF